VWAFWRVFSAVFSARLAAFRSFLVLDASAAARRIPCMSSSSARWAYQMAIVPMAAKPAIASG
jgi:hypothetical protein